MMSPTSNRRGFTLIEMLTVLVIIGILLAITLPAITGITRSAALQSATRQLTSTLGLARQYAITQRTHTRVVFPYSGTSSPALDRAPAYLSFSVMASNRSSQTWEYINRWDFLPTGAILVGDTLNGLRNQSIPFIPTNASATLAYIEFKPTGGSTRSTTETLTVGEGLTMTTSPYWMTTSVNYAEISIDNLVGQIKVTRP